MNTRVLVGIASSVICCLQVSAGLFDSIKEAAGKAFDDVSDVSKSAMKSVREGTANGVDSLADIIRPESTNVVSAANEGDRVSLTEKKQVDPSIRTTIVSLKNEREVSESGQGDAQKSIIYSKHENSAPVAGFGATRDPADCDSGKSSITDVHKQKAGEDEGQDEAIQVGVKNGVAVSDDNVRGLQCEQRQFKPSAPSATESTKNGSCTYEGGRGKNQRLNGDLKNEKSALAAYCGLRHDQADRARGVRPSVMVQKHKDGQNADVISNFVAFVTRLFSDVDRYESMRDKAQWGGGASAFNEVYSEPHSDKMNIPITALPFSCDARTNNNYRCFVGHALGGEIACPRDMQAFESWRKGIEKNFYERMLEFEVRIAYNQFVNEELIPQKEKIQRLIRILKECYENTPWAKRCHELDRVEQKISMWRQGDRLFDLNSDLYAESEYIAARPSGRRLEEEECKKILYWIELTRKWLKNQNFDFQNGKISEFFSKSHKKSTEEDSQHRYVPMRVYADVCFAMTPEMVYRTLVENSKEGKIRAERFNNSELFRGWDLSHRYNAKRWIKVPNGMSFVAKLREYTVRFLFGASERGGETGLIAVRLYSNIVENAPTASEVGEHYAKLPGVKMHKERKQNGSTWRKGVNPFWTFLYETSMLQIGMTEQEGVGEFGPLTEQEKTGLEKLKKDMKIIENDFATPVFIEMDVYESEGVMVTINVEEKTKRVLSIFIDEVAVMDAMKKLVGEIDDR